MVIKYLLKKIIPKVNAVVSQTLECVYDRIELLEKDSHKPVFSKKDCTSICERLDKLEKRRK